MEVWKWIKPSAFILSDCNLTGNSWDGQISALATARAVSTSSWGDA